MRLSRRPGLLLLVLLTGGMILLLSLLPPRPLLQITAVRWLPDGTEWKTVGRTGFRPFLSELRWPGRPFGAEAAEVALDHSFLRGALSGEWRFSVRRAALVPSDPRWPRLEFDSGGGRWQVTERRLELRDWRSSYGSVEADLVWSDTGRLRTARIRGEADPSELRKAFRSWKVLPDPAEGDPAAAVRRLPFELTYEKGALMIRVDGKPFFRAAWRSDGAF